MSSDVTVSRAIVSSLCPKTSDTQHANCGGKLYQSAPPIVTDTLPLLLLLLLLFSEMMSVLYNFVKVDTEAFLSNPKHIEIIISMCKTVSIHVC